MLCMQSVATSALAFIALNPFSLDSSYTPVLQESDLVSFGVEDSHELGYYVLCAVKNPVSASTVNLRCPIVVHPETRQAQQIIMEAGTYDMRHPLAEFGRSEEARPC